MICVYKVGTIYCIRILKMSPKIYFLLFNQTVIQLCCIEILQMSLRLPINSSQFREVFLDYLGGSTVTTGVPKSKRPRHIIQAEEMGWRDEAERKESE